MKKKKSNRGKKTQLKVGFWYRLTRHQQTGWEFCSGVLTLGPRLMGTAATVSAAGSQGRATVESDLGNPPLQPRVGNSLFTAQI